MPSNNCKLFHQTRRPSYNRAEKATEQLLFGDVRISSPAAEQHLERSKPTDEEWRRTQLQSSGSDTSTSSIASATSANIPIESMHGYGDSWFENLNALGMEYNRRKAEEILKARTSPSEATPAMHGYGDSWFENLNAQREEFEHRKSEELERESHQMHNYGANWFHNFEPQWEDWKHVKMDTDIKENCYMVDSDDESCEIGQ